MRGTTPYLRSYTNDDVMVHWAQPKASADLHANPDNKSGSAKMPKPCVCHGRWAHMHRYFIRTLSRRVNSDLHTAMSVKALTCHLTAQHNHTLSKCASSVQLRDRCFVETDCKRSHRFVSDSSGTASKMKSAWPRACNTY